MQQKNIRLLIVDDDEDDFFLTSNYLKDIRSQQFDITWGRSFNEGVMQLAQAKFDLCFFDFFLGAKTGLDLLKSALGSGIDCPIVLLTGKGDRAIDVEAMQLGAVDYLMKDELDSEKLERCIRYALERAQVMRHLRESEMRLRKIFEQMKDAILLKSPEGMIFYHNVMALRLFGYDESAILELHFKDLFALPADYDRFVNKARNQDSTKDFEVWMLRKNGERVQCCLNVSKQIDNEGQVYYLLVIEDMTARKKLERDRIISEKAASTARLARTLAHELRNPLTNIHLSLDQLEPDPENEDLQLFTDIIRRNSHRINDLVTELLDSFKPQEAVLKQISIQDLIDKALAEAADRMSLKKITLQKEFGEDCLLQLDEPKIKIALLNLIINAIEAMEDQKGVLTISTHVAAGFYYVEIQDNGTGISPEDINRLFEPYFTSKINGLGLGLAATLTLLQSHHASVEVESELGRGTTFTVTFPLQKELEE